MLFLKIINMYSWLVIFSQFHHVILVYYCNYNSDVNLCKYFYCNIINFTQVHNMSAKTIILWGKKIVDVYRTMKISILEIVQ